MTTAAQPKKRLSRSGLELIKSFEGLRRRAARLPNGRFVLGYGHIRSAREGAEIGPDDAEALLRYDLLPIEAAINEWALAPLTQNQFDALVSFAFNIGLSSFRRSDVLRRINEGDLLRAAAGMDTWRRVDLDGEPVIVDALVRRRAVEKALFLTPPEGQVPAPSAVLKPQVDTTAYSSILLRRPEELETPFDGDNATAFRAEPDDLPFMAAGDDAGDLPPDSEDLEYAPDAGPTDGPDMIIEETTTVIPAGPDPELEPELVLTETTVLVSEELAEELAEELEQLDEEAEEDELAMSPAGDLDFSAEPEFDEDEITSEHDAETTRDDEAETTFDDEEEEPEQEELSAAQAAAAAVFARLSEILKQDQEEQERDGDLSSLTIDPEPETADGEFLQAPPSPLEDEDRPGVSFPEMSEAELRDFAHHTVPTVFEPAPAAGELQPFADMAELPPAEEPEAPSDFETAFIEESEFEPAQVQGEEWDQRSGSQPSQGDPEALAAPLEENNRAGPLIFAGLAGLTLIIASLVSFARTPAPGAADDGSGWTFLLGALGVLLICGASWFALPPEDGDNPPEA